jgi:hypothetical protein
MGRLRARIPVDDVSGSSEATYEVMSLLEGLRNLVKQRFIVAVYD